jgi:hypothetical protein
MPEHRITSIRDHKGWELIVKWQRDEDGHGWEGGAKWFDRDGERATCAHVISVRLGQPLGSLSVALDEVQVGAWAYASLPASDCSNHDLQWATVWAKEAIRSKHFIQAPAGGCSQKITASEEEPQ